MDRVETRELAYFLAVASECHFGRAAARLGMSQPPLSRAIRQLERRVGVALLERNSRGVRLTPAGEVLAVEAEKALAAVGAAVERARRAAAPQPGLAVAIKAGGDAGLLPDILAEFRREPDAPPVEVVVCDAAERAVRLREGRVDAAFLHANFDDVDEFDTEPLATEGSVVVVPCGHRLARNDSVALSDLDGETFPRWRGMPHDAGAATREVRNAAEMMQHIALGNMVAVVPDSVRGQLRDDLACVPVRDAPPNTVVLAWPRVSRSTALAAFVRVATAVATRRAAQPR